MIVAIAIVALLAVASGLLATQRAIAATGERPCPLTEHCYLTVELRDSDNNPIRDWNVHNNNAIEIGGHLATISDQDENDIVMTFHRNRTWIGANDVAEEGTWVWADDEPVTFFDWGNGEPNGFPVHPTREEDYVEIHRFGAGGTWNDLSNAPGNNDRPFTSVVEFEALVVPDPDTDGDGVLDTNDVCPGTVIPESIPTTGKLGVNRWALVDGDGNFDTTDPNGKGPRRSYTIDDTAGCSGEQIADALELGKGHYKFGLTINVMDEWVSQHQ